MDDEELEELWDHLTEDGQVVFEKYWMSTESHGGEETDTVILYSSNYYAILAYEEDPVGPFQTLELAIMAGKLDRIDEATIRIEAPGLGNEWLQSLLMYTGTLSHILEINGQKWKTIAGHKLESVVSHQV